MWQAVIVAGALEAVAPQPTLVPIVETLRVDPKGHGCLETHRLAEQMRLWLERERIDRRIEIRASADVKRRDRVHFSIRRDGELVLDRPFEPVPGDCDATHAALGLAIAIALDATVLDTIVVDPAARPPPAAAASERPSDRRVSLGLQGTAAFGLHPIAGFGGQFRTEVSIIPAVTLRIGANSTTGLATDLGQGTATVTLIAGRFGACAGTTARSAVLRGCLGVLGGAAGVTGHGHSTDLRGFGPWVAPFAGFSLSVPGSADVAFIADVEAIVPAVTPRLVVNDSETGEVADARTLPPVGGMLSVGVAFQYP